MAEERTASDPVIAAETGATNEKLFAMTTNVVGETLQDLVELDKSYLALIGSNATRPTDLNRFSVVSQKGTSIDTASSADSVTAAAYNGESTSMPALSNFASSTDNVAQTTELVTPLPENVSLELVFGSKSEFVTRQEAVHRSEVSVSHKFTSPDASETDRSRSSQKPEHTQEPGTVSNALEVQYTDQQTLLNISKASSVTLLESNKRHPKISTVSMKPEVSMATRSEVVSWNRSSDFTMSETETFTKEKLEPSSTGSFIQSHLSTVTDEEKEETTTETSDSLPATFRPTSEIPKSVTRDFVSLGSSTTQSISQTNEIFHTTDLSKMFNASDSSILLHTSDSSKIFNTTILRSTPIEISSTRTIDADKSAGATESTMQIQTTTESSTSLSVSVALTSSQVAPSAAVAVGSVIGVLLLVVVVIVVIVLYRMRRKRSYDNADIDLKDYRKLMKRKDLRGLNPAVTSPAQDMHISPFFEIKSENAGNNGMSGDSCRISVEEEATGDDRRFGQRGKHTRFTPSSSSSSSDQNAFSEGYLVNTFRPRQAEKKSEKADQKKKEEKDGTGASAEEMATEEKIKAECDHTKHGDETGIKDDGV